jgi:hypothetical protein
MTRISLGISSVTRLFKFTRLFKRVLRVKVPRDHPRDHFRHPRDHPRDQCCM